MSEKVDWDLVLKAGGISIAATLIMSVMFLDHRVDKIEKRFAVEKESKSVPMTVHWPTRGSNEELITRIGYLEEILQDVHGNVYPKRPDWKGGHTTVALVKHSKDCPCLK